MFFVSPVAPALMLSRWVSSAAERCFWRGSAEPFHGLYKRLELFSGTLSRFRSQSWLFVQRIGLPGEREDCHPGFFANTGGRVLLIIATMPDYIPDERSYDLSLSFSMPLVFPISSLISHVVS